MESLGGEENFSFLNNHAPCFPVSGDNVKVLENPSDFFSCLMNGIKSAKKRIVISALYLGTDQLEKELINCVEETLSQRQSENISMDVDILFDYVRGSRGDINTKTMLLPLVKKFDDPVKNCKTNVSVSLYHTPFLRGLWKKGLPARFNEVVGLNHLKIFIFDDSFLISGANLSENYFQERQDRYIVFENCQDLANYFHTLVHAVQSFSFKLNTNGETILSDKCPHHPVTGDIQEFVKFAHTQLNAVIHPYYNDMIMPKQSIVQQGYLYLSSALTSSKQSLKKVFGLTNKFVCDDDQSDKGVTSATKLESKSDSRFSQSLDTLVYPTVQFGFIGLRQDEIVTKKIFDSFSSGSFVCFTSGYFNITETYSSKILNTFADFDIVTASPEANGFLTASGFAGKIPAVYCHLTKKFFDQVLENGKSGNIKVWEYIRPNWTYHAKGLWYYGKKEPLPSMTMIGSPNFGLRSVNRDLEAQVTIVTKNIGLMKQLHQERCALMKWSKPVTSETFLQSRYFVPRWVSVVTALIKHYF